MKTKISFFCHLFILLVYCHLNTNSVLADQSHLKALPSIEAVLLTEFAENGKKTTKPTEFWNKTIDNETSIIASKNWELAITCRAAYPVEWVTTGTIDTKRQVQVRHVWREIKGNRGKLTNYFVSRFGQPLLNTGWVRCRSIENHTIATEIFLFVKDTRQEATVFVNSSHYYKHKESDPKVIPCGITDPNLSVPYLLTNGHRVDDAIYDPRIGFLLHNSTEKVTAESFFQCRVNSDVFNHKLNGLTTLVSEPEESNVSAFDNNTLKFVCKSNKKIKATTPPTDENLHVSTHSITENDVTISIRGKNGQKGQVTCESEDSKIITWEFTFQEKPKIYQRPSLNDILCETSGTGVASFTSLTCMNKNTCELNRKCLEDGKCSEALKFANGVTLNGKEIKIVQPPLSGLVQCRVDGAREIKDIFRGLDDKYYFDVDEAKARNVLLAMEVKGQSTEDQNLYTDEEIFVVCKSVSYLFIPDFLIEIIFSDGKNKTLTDEDYREDESDEFFDMYEKPGVTLFGFYVNLTKDTKEIVCKATWAYSSHWYHVKQKVHITETTSPQVKFQSNAPILTLGDTSQLVCEATGYPEPNVTWKTNITGAYNVNVTKGEKYGIVFATITFPEVENAHEGFYDCEASNRLGSSKKRVYVTTDEPRSLTQVQLYSIIFGSTFAILLLIGLIICLWIRYKKTLKILRNLTDEEIEQFIKGSPELIKDFVEVHEYAPYLPYNKDYEIPIKYLDIDRSDVLGSGAFGVVVKGMYKNEPVAVKMTKPNAEASYFKALLSELKIMIYIGHHPNIVRFIGSFTEHIKNRILYIIVELCPGGNLQSYLRKYEKELKNVENPTSGPLYTNTASSQIKRDKKQDFLLRAAKWSRNIADGMEYLANKKVIHGDLACRNVLLSSDDVAKVTDFGLSRQLYEYSNYTKKTEAPLPWRWMAIESLAQLEFSSKSDVWSYGVTLWELYSLGHVPFPGQNWTSDFVEMIHKGTRMKKPKYASSEIYEIMGQCWSIIPEQRPSFMEMSDFFRQLEEEFQEDRK